jgi:hypothetical protein
MGLYCLLQGLPYVFMAIVLLEHRGEEVYPPYWQGQPPAEPPMPHRSKVRLNVVPGPQGWALVVGLTNTPRKNLLLRNHWGQDPCRVVAPVSTNNMKTWPWYSFLQRTTDPSENTQKKCEIYPLSLSKCKIASGLKAMGKYCCIFLGWGCSTDLCGCSNFLIWVFTLLQTFSYHVLWQRQDKQPYVGRKAITFACLK